jgi:SPX domain protein involved in polyphosphate accumulation
MSFEQKLEKLFSNPSSLANKYSGYYISYSDLKAEVADVGRIKIMKEHKRKERKTNKQADHLFERSATNGLLKAEQSFQDSLQNELNKVNMFCSIKREDIFRSLQNLAEQCKVTSKSNPLVLADSIRVQSREIVHLEDYVRINYQGFTAIVQKFDDAVGSTVCCVDKTRFDIISGFFIFRC